MTLLKEDSIHAQKEFYICLISEFNQMFSVDTILLLLYKMLYVKGNCKSSKGLFFSLFCPF
jgi:hypothetical protein